MPKIFDLSNFDKYKEDNCREVKRAAAIVGTGKVITIVLNQRLRVCFVTQQMRQRI